MILDKKSDWFSRVMYKKYIFVSEYIVKLKTRVMLNAMRTFFVFLSVGLLGFLFSVDTCAADRVYNVSDFGLKANVKKDASHVLRKVLDRIRKDYREGDKIVLQFPVGQYHFYEKNATIREYYISNHDQTNPKKVGIAIEEMRDFTLDGQGSEFIFHGRMLPISLLRS